MAKEWLLIILMIKNKILSFILTITSILYMLVLSLLKDPFSYNYSMYTSSIKGYLIVFLLCILLGINFVNTTYLLNKRYTLLALLAPIVGGIFPFNINNRGVVSNIHEICAYISLFLVLFITYININKYKIYNYEKANTLEKLFIIIFILDGLIYLKLLGVTSIQEFILLTTSLIIHLYIYLNITC